MEGRSRTRIVVERPEKERAGERGAKLLSAVRKGERIVVFVVGRAGGGGDVVSV